MGTGVRCDRWQILILAAVTMTGILGVTALALDAAFMYDKRNRLHAAADAAAKTGAIEVRRSSGISTTDLKRFADQQIQAHGFTPVATNCPSPGAGTLVCVHHPPVSGPFTGNAAAVEVIVSERTGTFFGKVLGWLTGNPGARAVAGTAPGPDCIVTFDHISLTNPASGNNVTMPNCGIVIGPQTTSPTSTDLDNQATITAKSIGVVHTGSAGCKHNCANVTYGVPIPTDPLASLPALAAPAGPLPNCAVAGQFVVAGTVSVTVADVNKYYCGWHFPNDGTLNLAPGNYYIDGLITDQNGGSTIDINCTGCMIFLTAGNGRIKLTESNHVRLTMSAPTSGPYSGILFYQDRGAPANNRLNFGKNDTTLEVSGAFYFRQGTMVMKNENSNTMANPCTLIVAYAIEVEKPNFQLDNTCLNFGGSPILSLSLGE